MDGGTDHSLAATCLYHRECKGYLEADVGHGERLCKPCRRKRDVGPTSKTLKPKPQLTELEKILREEPSRSIAGSTERRLENGDKLRDGYQCSECHRAPVSRKGNVCSGCRRRRDYSPTGRAINWGRDLRSIDERDGDDHVRSRDRGRWRPDGVLASAPSDWDDVGERMEGNDQSPADHSIANAARERNHLPPIGECPRVHFAVGIGYLGWSPAIEARQTTGRCPVCGDDRLGSDPLTVCLACLNASGGRCLVNMTDPYPVVSAEAVARATSILDRISATNGEMGLIPARPKRGIVASAHHGTDCRYYKDWPARWRKLRDGKLNSMFDWPQFRRLFIVKQDLLHVLANVERHTTEGTENAEVPTMRIDRGRENLGRVLRVTIGETPPDALDIAMAVGCHKGTVHRVIAELESKRKESARRRTL